MANDIYEHNYMYSNTLAIGGRGRGRGGFFFMLFFFVLCLFLVSFFFGFFFEVALAWLLYIL